MLECLLKGGLTLSFELVCLGAEPRYVPGLHGLSGYSSAATSVHAHASPLAVSQPRHTGAVHSYLKRWQDAERGTQLSTGVVGELFSEGHIGIDRLLDGRVQRQTDRKADGQADRQTDR